MLVVLERECQALREEVEHLKEKQEVLTILMEGKMNMHKVALEKYQEKIFEVLKELEEQKTRAALERVQRKHKLFKWECEKGESKDVAKVGVVTGRRTVVQNPGQFLYWFVLILPGF